MADASLVDAIRRAAAATPGADPVLLLATSIVEDGARWGSPAGPVGLGDYVAGNPTSFGPFQFHIGGALGSNPPSWAFTYAAVLNRAQAFARAGVTNGTGAAAVQGPHDPAGYAVKVNAAIPQARALLASSSSSSSTSTPPGSAIAAAAASQQGVPYSWAGGGLGGKSYGAPNPNGGPSGATILGFDCSGLVQFALGQVGVVVPHSSVAQYQLGVPVAKGDLQPGDLVFFEPSSTGPQHVGVYIGGGKFEAAPHTGSRVDTFDLSSRSDYVGARRIVASSSVNRNGHDVAGVPGRLQPADSSQLAAASAAFQKYLKSRLGGGSTIDIPSPGELVAPLTGGADLNPKDAATSALNGVGGAITSAVDSMQQWAVKEGTHALVWIALVSLGVGLVVLGAKRLIDPTGEKTAGAGAMLAEGLAA